MCIQCSIEFFSKQSYLSAGRYSVHRWIGISAGSLEKNSPVRR